MVVAQQTLTTDQRVKIVGALAEVLQEIPADAP
jgi:hypothetical protein